MPKTSPSGVPPRGPFEARLADAVEAEVNDARPGQQKHACADPAVGIFVDEHRPTPLQRVLWKLPSQFQSQIGHR